jgi:hypothetical protein
VNDELEESWKETVVAYQGTSPTHDRGTEKNHEDPQSGYFLAQFQTKHVQNDSLKRYRCANLLGFMIRIFS